MGRLVFNGILNYANEHPECRSWRFHPPLNKLAVANLTLEKYKPHGVISQVSDPEFLKRLDSQGVPRVNVSTSIEDSVGPSVVSDNFNCGVLAANHFLEKRFRNFAYLGVHGAYYSNQREQGFRESLKEANVTEEVHFAELVVQTLYLDSALPEDLENWIAALPRPVGLFAATDGLARQVVEVCEQRNIRCPDEVAVLGVDNDELECAISPVKLSSVSLPFQSIGWTAAQTLHRLFDKSKDPHPDEEQRMQILPPIGILTRGSTEFLAVEDPVLRKGLEWIREASSEELSVMELARVCGVSRRYLERSFRYILGCSPNDAILRHRIQRVQFMLADTNLTVTEIARRLGYREPKYLHRVFKKLCGCSPMDYRKLFRS